MDDSDPATPKDAWDALQRLLAKQTQAGVPKQVLVGLLREQAAGIECHGYIPRR
jgi:hypothetical protein